MKKINLPPAAPSKHRNPSPVPALDLRAYQIDDGILLLAFDLDPARNQHLRVLSRLTRGQQRVVELAMMGLSDREIATGLGLSRHTVSNLLRRAYSRLGVSGRVELCSRLRSDGGATDSPTG